jgi:DNA-binding MarR family transcriptional regulator
MTLQHTLSNFSIHELSMAQMLVTRNADEFNHNLSRRYNVTPIEWLILSSVSKHSPQGIRVTDLAKLFDVKTTYITSVLNGLRSKSYVITRFDPNDARVRLTVVSKAGTKQLERIEEYAHQALLERLDGVVSGQDFERYATVLMRLARL